MQLLIDAQLPPALCDWFMARGIDAVHVRDVLSGQAPDREIASLAEQQALVLVTKDDSLLRYPPDRARLVWLRCGNISNRGLRLWLQPRWPLVEARLAQGEKIVEVR